MEKDLRLRLVVRRHGVPDVKLLWNTTADEDLTISKLLAQINEVVPLESGEWGLEDYAVELKDASGDAFECVHYHLVSKLLKDDDQVLVRPLLTGDLKRRRLSGRHQISIDGRHLVDGLAFGRPWLRAPRDRPAVTLPPRKKARIAYSSEDEQDSLPENDEERPMLELEYGSTRAQEDPASVKLRTRFHDADPDSDSEVEHNYDPDVDRAEEEDDDDNMDSDDGEIQDELRLLREDNAAVREGDILEELRDIRNKRASSGPGSSRSAEASGDSPAPSAGNALVRSGGQATRHRLSLDTLDKIAALKAAFPGAQVSAIEETLLKYDADSARTYRKLRKTFAARLSLQQTLDHQAQSLSSSPIRHAHKHASTGRELVLRESSPSERASNATAHDEDEDEEDNEDASITLNHNTATDRCPGSGQEGSDSDSDSDSESESDSDSDSGSDVAAATSDLDREAEDSSDDDSEASSSDDDDGDGSQDEDEEDDGSSEPEDGGSVLDEEDADSVDQDASSSNDDSESEASGSDGSSVAAANNGPPKDDAAISISSDSSSDSSSEDSSSDDSSSDSEPEEIPSKTLTSQRQILEDSQPQAPRKLPQATPAAPAAPANEQPTVPPGQGLSKTQKRNARRKLAKQLAAGKSRSAQGSEEPSQTPAIGASAEEASFLARKQALLNAIASDRPVDHTSEESFQGLSDSTPREREHSLPSSAGAGPMVASQSVAGQAEASAQRRIKPNIGATRRMLMGSLGLKNPKTKADEDKIRQDLMKGVRPHTNARLAEAASQHDEPPQTHESVEEDAEAWREKIAYRAVECCHDGIELSEPPFPFVQRWDPQQQVDEWFGSKNKRGGKRKRAQRNQAQFYEDGDPQASKKRRVTGESMGVTFSDAAESLEEGDTTLNYDDPPEEPLVPKTAAEGSQATDVDDLPSLPADLTKLPDLRPGEAKLGMVITWKQWLLSPATNWQPEVVNLTGVLVRVHDEEATDLEFLLAHRDREVDRTEKKYDEETGQRVYDRFEAPDDDDDDDADDEPDRGYRRLTYAELIEPKIVQLPLEDRAKPADNEGSSVPLTDSIVHETVYDDHSQPYQVNGEDAGRSEADKDGSQLPIDAEDGRAKANTDDEQPRIVADPRFSHSPDAQPDNVEAIDEENMSTPRANTHAHDEYQPPTTENAESQNSDDSALSVTSDRRHEISIMIQDAGFRKGVSPSVLRQKTSSPSRQLLEMAEVASHSRVASRSPLSQESMVKVATQVPNKELGPTAGSAGGGAAAPSSCASSIRSGRQLDPDDLGFNVSGDDLHQISDMGDGSLVLDDDVPTPKAKGQTPTRNKETSASPSTDQSFPSLASLARTASQQNLHSQTQSPSKAQALVPFLSRDSTLPRNEEYEAAMRRIDESDSDEEDGKDEAPLELRKTRKRLFPASGRPDQSPLSESADMPDIKPVAKTASSPLVGEQGGRLLRQRVHKSSPFAVPPGSQVVTLSSSPSSSPPQEDYAEDSIDADYEDGNRRNSLGRSSGRVQKTRAPRASSRAKSVPANQATARSASARRSIPPSSMPANPGVNGRGQRMPSSMF
ncbi:hypothetical protein CGRA01v4_11095 [Colletotrichum graminicola]|uniref:DUF7357 domain-containing protein n=1 Tax=Colletotrichum graminicola (strain M1.001 / M2 / FGSC 10212) TaxID=645133 RepID=E3QKW0_COLGM|nr:uncharacterized protein GLRG_06642 [Colletotrichum graminicola M1.001]EFQ31498.1 hypothetical protein GLRG_06642 [Colletotrichum graminicola M1.001]WDK19808.1 hypothetical protein CGRA01v4_11095 [Colletotrichum graminicola]